MNFLNLLFVPGFIRTLLRVIFYKQSRAHYREQRKMS
jgi:hypothetical protein